MYGHVPQYLDAQRLRNELARTEMRCSFWRNAAWTFGPLAVALLWACFHLSDQLSIRSEQYRQAVHGEHEKMNEYRELAGRQQASEANFKRCLSANGGLVESLHDFDQVTRQQRDVIVEQQQLLRAAIGAAKRCDAGPGPALLEARNAW